MYSKPSFCAAHRVQPKPKPLLPSQPKNNNNNNNNSNNKWLL